MLTLITGVPGAGKSLRAVALVQDALKAGRAVYSDIDGHNAPGVLPSPDDWRDTPEGSLVVYDEAQRKFPSTGKPGVAEDERIRALETHRHTGHDIIFITQSPALIHHHIRKLVGRHIHVHRAAGLKRATLYTWDFAVASPNDRVEQQRADTENWQYPADLFKFYKSATVHTHKFQIPKKIAWALGAFVLVAAVVGFRFYSSGGLAVLNQDAGSPKTLASEAANRAEPVPPPQSPDSLAWSTPALPSVSGCALTSVACRCWDGEGAQLALTHGQCLTMVANPLPINFSEFKSKRAGKRTAASQPAREKLGPGPVPAEGSSSETPFSALPGASALSFSADGQAVGKPSP